MPPADPPPHDDTDAQPAVSPSPSESPSPEQTAKLRFEQARSIGIVLVLVTLLGLVAYNAATPDTPWESRTEDVRLLMTLLSVLLGIDVLASYRADLLRAAANGLLALAGEPRASTSDTDTDTTTTTNTDTNTKTADEARDHDTARGREK